MMNEGICLVISFGSVNERPGCQFAKRNIKAIALTGGIRSDEMIDLLDCQFGNYKFLYLSRNALQSGFYKE
jgi:ATP-dependent DNA helicase RecQ